MTVKLGTGSSAVDLSQLMIGGVAANKIMVGTGSSAVQAWSAGVSFTDALDSLSAFTVTSNGSGITISSGQAQWGGTTDGNGTALYNSSPASLNRYAAITTGNVVSTNRYSGVILCTDEARSRSYGVSFTRDNVWFKDTTGAGNWMSGAFTDLATASVSIGTGGDLIEVWNIGTLGYVAVNGTTVISGVALDSAKLTSAYNKQGFGIYRASFGNSSPIASWRGGDASEWGKS